MYNVFVWAVYIQRELLAIYVHQQFGINTHTHARTQMLPGTLSNALARFPLGSGELEEEPLYVNAKQYHRILKRRQARARLEQEGKIPKQRQVCVCVCVRALCT